MDISSISKYYELRPLSVKPDRLLLDPNNPRIVLDVATDRKFTNAELSSADVQEFILSVINKQSHHIADLIRGIRSSGFIDKGDDMIVKRIPRSDKFLVIEGNRRTTAIKHLLGSPDGLKPAVRETLALLQVKEFIYKPNSEFSEEAVIDILLGTIHINGRLPWGALERALYVYRSYLREMAKYTGNSKFEYHTDCAQEVATFFNLSVKAVRKEIAVYRVYEQLKENEYDVAPHHFSLIEMAYSNKKLRKEYFGWSSDSFRFSKSGIESFDKLCIRSTRMIHNPKDFRGFTAIFRHGNQDYISLVESNELSIESALDRIDGYHARHEFLLQLQEIKEKLDDLFPAAFRNTSAELDMIKRIKVIVDEKLWRLVRDASRN